MTGASPSRLEGTPLFDTLAHYDTLLSWSRSGNAKKTEALSPGQSQVVVRNSLLTYHTKANVDINMGAAIHTNQISSPLSAGPECSRGSLLNAQHAKQACSL